VELAGIVGDESPRVGHLSAFDVHHPKAAACIHANRAALARRDVDRLSDARDHMGAGVSDARTPATGIMAA
jgi:hypothetical protein